MASLVLETIVAGLLAPVVMLTQSVDVAAILAGRDSGWNPQRRGDGSLPFGETVRRYRRHTFLGGLMGIAAWLVSPTLALWMSPVVLGLALAIPLAALTSRRDGGFARLGLLRIPEEVHPPDVLGGAASRYRDLVAAAADDKLAAPERLLRDPALLVAHRAMLPLPRRPGIDPLDVPLLTGRAKLEEARDLDSGWTLMTREERAACLADAEALDLITARVRTAFIPLS
jgi:membrane glycosyltransferase